MSGSFVKRRNIDDAVLEMLTRALSFPVGFALVPEGVDFARPKYAVLTPVDNTGETYGPPLAAPEADAALEYDVTSVGEDRRQAAWIADEVRRIMVGRNAHGAFLADLDAQGHYVDSREGVGVIGAPRLESGVWQVVDSYRVRVSRA